MKIVLLVWLGVISAAQAKWDLEKLSVDKLKQPVGVSTAPNDAALYVVEQRGKIWRVEGKNKTLFLDIEKKVYSGGECGLLSVVFHPDYAKNGRYFVNYTAKRPNLQTVVAEISKTGERDFLLIDQPFSNHNGGQLAFDRAGLLYVGMGDGGSAGDPRRHGQNRESLLGKMLRLDVDKSDPARGKNYSIPKDNPFAKGGGAPEIFAYGLRNPWRFSFDSQTGFLWAGDVGQNKWEEIDIIENGKNYGWNTMEGKHCFDPPMGCLAKGTELPVHEYEQGDNGYSVTGGYVYRGKRTARLQGHYIFGDYVSGKIWASKLDAGGKKILATELLLDRKIPVSSFGLDADGEILVVSHAGDLYRIVDK